MPLTPVEASSQVGNIRVFTSNGGTPTVETITDMSMHTLCDPQSNPVKMAAMKAQLQDLYAQARKTIHFMFKLVADEKNIENRQTLKASIVEVISRDFNTLLDIERKLYKE